MKTLVLAAAAALAFATPSFAHAGTMHEGCPDGQTFTAGTITVSGAFSRATLPNAKAAGGFMLIENTGTEADRLVGASTEGAAKSEIHEMKMEGDMMKMAELPDGLEIPAGATVTLAPGGFHVMLMGLVQPLREDECLAVTLTFEKAGDLPVLLSIGAPNATAPDAMDHEMDHDAMAPAN